MNLLQSFHNILMEFITEAELLCVESLKSNSTFTLHCDNFLNVKANLTTRNTLHINLNNFTKYQHVVIEDAIEITSNIVTPGKKTRVNNWISALYCYTHAAIHTRKDRYWFYREPQTTYCGVILDTRSIVVRTGRHSVKVEMAHWRKKKGWVGGGGQNSNVN